MNFTRQNPWREPTGEECCIFAVLLPALILLLASFAAWDTSEFTPPTADQITAEKLTKAYFKN